MRFKSWVGNTSSQEKWNQFGNQLNRPVAVQSMFSKIIEIIFLKRLCCLLLVEKKSWEKTVWTYERSFHISHSIWATNRTLW